MEKRTLSIGIYEPTENFRQIKEHTAIIDAETEGLIALTGPWRDERSAEYAWLFSAAPALLGALKEIVSQAESYCRSTGHKEPGAAMFGSCDSICACLPAARLAIAAAEGNTTSAA